MHRARYVGRGVGLPCSLWACHPPSTLVPNPEALQIPWFRVFMGFYRFYRGFYRIDKNITHWWLNSISSPCPFPRDWGVISTDQDASPGKRHTRPYWGSRSHLININPGVVERSLLRKTKDVPSPLCSTAISGARDKIQTKDVPSVLTILGNYKDFFFLIFF